MMNKTIYIQFTAGKGPTECAVACKQVFNNFCKDCKRKCSIVETEEDYEEGFRSIVVEIADISEEELYSLKSKWEGTVKYIATKNHIRPNHKRKNWFIGVNFFEAPETIYDGNLNEKDLKWEYMRSSGPGGQNVNKVSSAVRVTHIHTGISVKCDSSRDQTRNKEIALKILIAKLKALDEAKFNDQKNLIWMNHNELERGNEVLTLKGEL